MFIGGSKILYVEGPSLTTFEIPLDFLVSNSGRRP